MGQAEGFRYSVSKAGVVTFTHHGRPAGTLRGAGASAFLAFADRLDEDSDKLQQRIARLTGNYKRGNERLGRQGQRGMPQHLGVAVSSGAKTTIRVTGRGWCPSRGLDCEFPGSSLAIEPSGLRPNRRNRSASSARPCFSSSLASRRRAGRNP